MFSSQRKMIKDLMNEQNIQSRNWQRAMEMSEHEARQAASTMACMRAEIVENQRSSQQSG